MRKYYISLATIAAMLNVRPPVMSAQVTDSSYVNLVKRLVSDSLRSAGRRQGEQFFAADSFTRGLLRASGIAGASSGPVPPAVNCPDIQLTGAEASPVGYLVTVRDSLGADAAQKWVQVRVSCSYPRRAPSSGTFSFYQWCVWELRRTPGGWVIARRTSCGIT